MEINAQVNTFTKGLNTDTDINYISNELYRFASNIRLITNNGGTTGVIQPVERIHQYSTGIPTDEIIIGTTTTFWHNGTSVEECGVVITKKTVNGNTFNTVYRITDLDVPNNARTVVVKGYLELENSLAVVGNYESDIVSNIYISDNETTLKVINLLENYGVDDITDHTRFDLTPGCVLLPFKFVTTISGSLPAGSIQYCYQLFNVRGNETTTAALSEVIPITSYDNAGDSKKIKGEKKGTITDKGCSIQATFANDGRFNKARIFSIVYLDANEIPSIYILNEIDIPYAGDFDFVTFTYNDTGGAYMALITIDEFNAMIPFEFKAASIEKLNNRLFAANLQEITWDIPDTYDTRSYSCSATKDISLLAANESENISGKLGENGTIISSGTAITIPPYHDCINPSNLDLYNESGFKYMYGYDDDGYLIFGGTGPNISYRFIFAEIVPSSTTVTSSSPVAYDLEMSAKPSTKMLMQLTYEDGTVAATHNFPTDRGIIPNYSDPYIVAKYLGYMRDEIYRFGIIFYNNKNIPSPVHWIADIRIPGNNDVVGTNSRYYPFHSGKSAYTYNDNTVDNDNTVELLAYAVGIEFKIKNIPNDAVAWEIVRCDRTQSDKTIVTQGILSSLQQYDQWGKNENNYGTIDIRPLPLFNLNNEFSTIRWDGEDPDLLDAEIVDDYYEFVSPEVCFSKDNIAQYIGGGKLYGLYWVGSYFKNSQTPSPQIGNKCGITLTKVYNTASDILENGDIIFSSIYSDSTTLRLYFDAGIGEGAQMPSINNIDYNNRQYGTAAVFKYYNIRRDEDVNTAYKIEDQIIGVVLPHQIDAASTKSYAQFIGSKAYINTSICGYDQIGIHGYNCILHTEEDFAKSNPYYSESFSTTDDKFHKFSTAKIFNIKKNATPYGGPSYVNRQSSIYISCGAATTRDINKIHCFGGDTYLGIFDYLNTSNIQLTNNTQDGKEDRMCTVCYIPLESSFNLNMRMDDSYHRQTDNLIGPNMIQNEPTAMASVYTQDESLYLYNTAYSSRSGSKKYVPKSLYTVNNNSSINRITCSELKTNNEINDSWTKFKFANYLDVDSQYGPITNLKAFNDRLYYFQDNAVGVAAINERSLITDNNIGALTLGTGDILARYDYLIVKNGSSVLNDKSITNSANTLYWYDFNKNEICALGNSFMELSKIKNVQTHLNKLTDKSNVRSFYDKKYNEVWFTFNDSTITYNEQVQAFTSFYTHTPQYSFIMSDKIVTLLDNSMYRINKEGFTETPVQLDCSVEFVNNKDVQYTKVFDNFIFGADIDSTLSGISFEFKTLRQESEHNPNFFTNTDYREDTYRFAIPRATVDTTQSSSYAERMRGKYLICTFKCEDVDNESFKIPYFKTTYRYSLL